MATSCGDSLPWSTGLSESLFAFCEAGDFEVTVLQALFERAALRSPVKWFAKPPSAAVDPCGVSSSV